MFQRPSRLAALYHTTTGKQREGLLTKENETSVISEILNCFDMIDQNGHPANETKARENVNLSRSPRLFKDPVSPIQRITQLISKAPTR